MSQINDPYTLEQIDFTERVDSFDYSYAGSTHALRRTFLCKWKERYGLAAAFMGGAEITGKDTPFPQLRRRNPVGVRLPSGAAPKAGTFLYATGIERMVGVGPTHADGKLDLFNANGIVGGRFADDALFQKAQLTVQFEAPTYRVLADDNIGDNKKVYLRVKEPATVPRLFVTIGEEYEGWVEYHRHTTRIIQPLTEAIRFPDQYWRTVEGYYQDGKAVAQPKEPFDSGGFSLYPKAEITYVWHQVPALTQPREDGAEWKFKEFERGEGVLANPYGVEPPGAIFTHIGCVNARWFDGYPPGTLLLLAAEIRPYRWVDGTRMMDITYRMVNWNPLEQISPDKTFPFLADEAGPVMTRDPTSNFSAIGHNHFPRLKFVKKEGTPDKPVFTFAAPYFTLLTHNGNPLERGLFQESPGRPIFAYRDFEDLFLPYNRAHMVRFYKNATLCPLFQEAGT